MSGFSKFGMEEAKRAVAAQQMVFSVAKEEGVKLDAGWLLSLTFAAAFHDLAPSGVRLIIKHLRSEQTGAAPSRDILAGASEWAARDVAAWNEATRALNKARSSASRAARRRSD